MGKKAKPAVVPAIPASDVSTEPGDGLVMVGHEYTVDVPHSLIGPQVVVVPLDRMEEGASAALQIYLQMAGINKSEHQPKVELIGPAYQKAEDVDGTS